MWQPQFLDLFKSLLYSQVHLFPFLMILLLPPTLLIAIIIFTDLLNQPTHKLFCRSDSFIITILDFMVFLHQVIKLGFHQLKLSFKIPAAHSFKHKRFSKHFQLISIITFNLLSIH